MASEGLDVLTRAHVFGRLSAKNANQMKPTSASNARILSSKITAGYNLEMVKDSDAVD